jgi:hypothetical protein
MRTSAHSVASFLRRTTPLIIAATLLASLAACGSGGGYGMGGGGAMPSSAAASKLFAADSTDRVVGSLANPDPAAGSLTVDRLIGPTSPYFYNYAGFSISIGSLALDTTRDILYVGNGTSVLIFYGASMANGDIFASATIGPIGNTGSMFVDSTHDLLYVGDDIVGVKVFSGASMANGSPTPRSITGDFGTTFQLHGVAVDTTSKNILYVSNTNHTTASDQISVFDNATTVSGSKTPDRTITPNPASSVGGISLDAGNDRLYVAGGSAGSVVMVFDTASTASGSTAPSKTLSGFPSGILNVVFDPVNDRLYAVGLSGHIYLVENVGTLSSGTVSAKDASLPNGGMLTAVAVNP